MVRFRMLFERYNLLHAQYGLLEKARRFVKSLHTFLTGSEQIDSFLHPFKYTAKQAIFNDSASHRKRHVHPT